jgi:hypothetical protein
MHEGWNQSGGFWVLKQSHGESCGYCCIGMALCLRDASHPRTPEKNLIVTGTAIGGSGAYSRDPRDRVNAVPTPVVSCGYYRPKYGVGTYGNHLAQVLNEGYHLTATYYGSTGVGRMKDAMRSVRHDRLMIVLVRWHAGGGHWVLVVRRHTRGWGAQSDYTILDPIGNVTPNRGSTVYSATYDDGTTAIGDFADYYVMIEGRPALVGKSSGHKLPGM